MFVWTLLLWCSSCYTACLAHSVCISILSTPLHRSQLIHARVQHIVAMLLLTLSCKNSSKTTFHVFQIFENNLAAPVACHSCPLEQPCSMFQYVSYFCHHQWASWAAEIKMVANGFAAHPETDVEPHGEANGEDRVDLPSLRTAPGKRRPGKCQEPDLEMIHADLGDQQPLLPFIHRILTSDLAFDL